MEEATEVSTAGGNSGTRSRQEKPLLPLDSYDEGETAIGKDAGGLSTNEFTSSTRSGLYGLTVGARC